MNARHGQPDGTPGVIRFDASKYAPSRTLRAVRCPDGGYYVNTHGSLWLPATIRPEQFTAGK